MTISDREVVAALGEAISQRIGEPRYNFWFERNTKFAWKDNQLTVGVPNHFFQDWLKKTFADAVGQAASAVLCRPMQVRFSIDPDLFQAARRAQEDSRPDAQAPPGVENPKERQKNTSLKTPRASGTNEPQLRSPSRRPRRWRRLSDFIVGPCNRLAHASAVSVVEAPGEGPNPLVLHGPVSTGKTHLLEAIYGGLRKRNPEWRVRFVTAEEFTNRFIQACRLGKLAPFRKHFREVDALLIDDLHFLARKRATQEEFLHTIDAILAEGKQLAVSCDCHPKLAEEFTPELTDRLVGGGVWGMAPPEADTRLAVLRHKAAKAEPPIPDEVLRFLAGQLRGNVRELEGALHTLRHFGKVAGRSLDKAMAREALGELLRHTVKVLQLKDIDQAVCQALQIPAGALQAKQRTWAVSHPRMLAMYLSRKHTSAAYSEIGRHFGGRNHSTAVAAEKKVRSWVVEEAELPIGAERFKIRELIEIVERELLR